MTNIPYNNFKKESLFLLTFSKPSVHGWQTPLLWAQGQIENLGQSWRRT